MCKTNDKFEDGIYRTVKLKNDNNLDNNNIPIDINNFIRIWQSSSGFYKFFGNEIHDLMATPIQDYLHITSPIERWSFINMMKLQSYLGLNQLSVDADNFIIIGLIGEYINTTMRLFKSTK